MEDCWLTAFFSYPFRRYYASLHKWEDNWQGKKPPLTGQTVDGGQGVVVSVYVKERRYQCKLAKVMPELFIIKSTSILNIYINIRKNKSIRMCKTLSYIGREILSFRIALSVVPRRIVSKIWLSMSKW